ncbi:MULTISPECIES: restriction endonuclease subunit S [Citrobacter]|jgi:type I restriction enzyme S subunit|uniref:restriction endonuclease subunit S n=1 Tax=Citrobacter TaxID=544 RepID=UPI001A1E2A5E|nr:restriction endonuclease subunit S [Citrobacter sp. Ce104]MDM3279085.1 restriction endonuclease subunit S [Citrobacter sp. Ce104]HAU5678992.1 restriction endonuclease subunit S [Citrobacter freundii]
MAKYKAYPEYKDSGVEWLGDIPAHWNIKRLGQLFEERREKVSDKEYPALSVTMQGIVPQLGTAAKTEAGDNRKLVLKDDFVINSRSDRKGSAGVSLLNGSVSLISIVMRPKNINPKFAHHLLRSCPFQEEFYRYGKGIVADLWSTNSSEMKNILLPEIQFSESEKISNFLDHETAKIDSLIEKQQQLIELLKEKRQAVISHAVTKGINPDAPMNDSGVEWLGAIPRNWNCVAIKNICKIVNGSTPKSSIEEYWDGDIDWFTPTDLSHKETIQINDSLRKITNSGFLSCGTTMVPANTVILSSRAPIGSLAITKKSACTNQGCKSLVTFSAQLSKYIYYSLLTFNSPLNNLGRGSTFLELSTDDLGGFKISLPNDDMGEIIKYIDITILKIDNLIEKQLQQIELLKERRTALISAAVTGKIDVRHWHAPDEQITGEAEAVV